MAIHMVFVMGDMFFDIYIWIIYSKGSKHIGCAVGYCTSKRTINPRIGIGVDEWQILVGWVLRSDCLPVFTVAILEIMAALFMNAACQGTNTDTVWYPHQEWCREDIIWVCLSQERSTSSWFYPSKCLKYCCHYPHYSPSPSRALSMY